MSCFVLIINNRSLSTNFKIYKIKLICDNNSEIEFEGFGIYKGYWVLNKGLYNLKQSGRQWNKPITKLLTKRKFQ